MEQKPNIGQILSSEESLRDAIHIAIYPAIAGHRLAAGSHVGLNDKGEASYLQDEKPIGIVDPFLNCAVQKGQRFYLFLYPNTITSLKHFWTHPSFDDKVILPTQKPVKSFSQEWMTKWAVRHMGEDYYGDGNPVSEETAYGRAIDAGYEHSVGPFESARDYINDEWWDHWENITSSKGDRSEGFSCGC